MILCRRRCRVPTIHFSLSKRKEREWEKRKEKIESSRIVIANILPLETRSLYRQKRSNLNAQILLCTVKSDTRFPSPVKTNGVRNNLHEERHIFLRQGGGGAHVFSQGRKRRSYAFEATRVIKKKKRKEKEKERNGAKAKSAVPV